MNEMNDWLDYGCSFECTSRHASVRGDLCSHDIYVGDQNTVQPVKLLIRHYLEHYEKYSHFNYYIWYK